MHFSVKTYKASLAAMIIIIAVSLFLFGCTSNKENKPGNSGEVSNSAKEKMHIGVYYVKQTQEGAYLVREEHVIPQTDEALKAAVEELIMVKPKTEYASNVIPGDTKVLDVKVKNATATVNFSKEVLNANVGSVGEVLGIQSIVNTLTEFPDVEAVSFQVEGSAEGRAKDWWGHVGLYDQPFKRDISNVVEPAIWVTHPQPKQVIGVPILVKGSARVWNGNISVQLVDENNNILAQVHGTATQSAPLRGDFEMSIQFDPPNKGSGELQVFGRDPDNGLDLIKVTVPVNWP
jgi:hypothetical protein